MNRWILTALVLSSLVVGAAAGPADKPPAKLAYIAVFDLLSNDPKAGASVADRIRLRMRRHRQYDVVDRITMQEASPPLGIDTDREKVVKLTKQLAANVAFYGTVTDTGGNLKAVVRCIDLREAGKVKDWTKTLSDNTERRHGLVARYIVEAFTGKEEWIPPQYGDTPVPKNLGKPINKNGSFNAGDKGWEPADNAATFLEKGPKGRGIILRVRTDLKRAPYIEYRRKLRFGQADPKNPPKIGRDTSFGSLAGLEGVHYRSEWIKATTGWQYWLAADFKGPGGKIFVKGFREAASVADGLPESSLAHLGMTAREFSNLPEKRRKYLIEQEAKKNPDTFRRECYRWYINLTGGGKDWAHMVEVFPPRGGLPKNVQWLRIDIYPYWPPGTYYYDNVHLYKDPNQKAPKAEQQPRTPDYSKPDAVRERAKGPKK